MTQNGCVLKRGISTYKSAEEMEQAFKHIPEALSNTVRIAEECHVEMDFTHHYFPVYELPEGMTLSTEFQRLAREGLKQRLELHPDRDTIDPKIYWDRLEMELKVICEMGFPGYFLIVQDFINWAKGNDIPGRSRSWFRGRLDRRVGFAYHKP